MVTDGVLGGLHLPSAGGSLAALTALSLVAALLAGLANNLPASIVLSGLLGSRGLGPYAALSGLSVGALATPHGSVATAIAFDRAGSGLDTGAYLRLWLPAATAGTLAATVCAWLVA